MELKMKKNLLNLQRPRLNRRSASIRDLVSETQVSASDLIYPVFIQEGQKVRHSIKTLPGQFRFSMDELIREIPSFLDSGIRALALFPKISDSLKTSDALEALNPKGFLPQSVRRLKKEFPELVIFTDIALDPYSSDGHDGLVKNGQILNDETVEILAKMAAVHAEAGADYVAPSDMMDGRIKAIRQKLETEGHNNTGIISYTAKYASHFYGPFREALDSAPRSGDKKTYQMDYRNSNEALRELKLDIQEGADIVMVKPALSYLDIIRNFKTKSTVPVAAYNVSGEYAMVKAASAIGAADHDGLMVEILTSIKRAGADMIFTYHAVEMAEWLKKNH
jgi:porphobilinogen synthase